MKFFSQDEIDKRKGQINSERQNAELKADAERNSKQSVVMPMLETFTLFQKMICDYPALARSFGKKPIKLKIRHGNFIDSYTEPLFPLNLSLITSNLYVSNSGKLYSYSFFDKERVGARAEYGLTQVTLEALIRPLEHCDGQFYYDVYGDYDIDFIHFLAKKTYRCSEGRSFSYRTIILDGGLYSRNEQINLIKSYLIDIASK